MIVVLKSDITDSEKDSLTEFLRNHGLRVRMIPGENQTVIGAVGQARISYQDVEILPGVAQVVPIDKPYKMASRQFHPQDSIVGIGSLKIGGSRIVIIAGPCAVESKEQIN